MLLGQYFFKMVLISKNTRKRRKRKGKWWAICIKKTEPLPPAFPGSPEIVSDSIDCDK